jgi:predicted acetyltransferase
MVVLRKVTKINIIKLKNLFNLFLHDLAEFNTELKIGPNCVYSVPKLESYYNHPGIISFLIYYKKEISGFVVISRPPYFSRDKKTSVIQHLFILKGYRNKGIGTEAMKNIFKEYPGKYGVEQLPENKNAVNFWKALYKKCKVEYEMTKGTANKAKRQYFEIENKK